MWNLTIYIPLGPSVLASTRSLLQSMWNPPIHPPAHRLVSTPLRGSASSLAHRLVFGSDTICNGPSQPLADMVLFGLSRLPLKVFKMCLLGRGFHTLIKGSRSSLEPTWELTYILKSKEIFSSTYHDYQ